MSDTPLCSKSDRQSDFFRKWKLISRHNAYDPLQILCWIGGWAVCKNTLTMGGGHSDADASSNLRGEHLAV